MDYLLAKLLGKIAFVAIWLATGYYCLRTAVVYCIKEPQLSGLKNGLLYFVPSARRIHPYIGVSLLFILPYHAYVMLTIYTVTLKVASGLLGLSAIGVMLVLGVALWRDKGNLRIRIIHRRFMYIVLAAATIHVMVR